MGLDTLTKGMQVKELSTKWPVIDPQAVAEAMLVKFLNSSSRQGENGEFKTYSLSVITGDMSVRIGKDEMRTIVGGETVSGAGKAFDDANFVEGRTYGIEFTGFAKAKRGRQAMKLYRIVEIVA